MFELRCREVGFECHGVVRGARKEAVLQQAATHAVDVHGAEVTPALAAKVTWRSFRIARVTGAMPCRAPWRLGPMAALLRSVRPADQ